MGLKLGINRLVSGLYSCYNTAPVSEAKARLLLRIYKNLVKVDKTFLNSSKVSRVNNMMDQVVCSSV